jgi:hypothetical protein
MAEALITHHGVAAPSWITAKMLPAGSVNQAM